MKLINIVQAYNAAQYIAPRKLEVRFNYAICKILRRFKGDFEFYAKREHELVRQYGLCSENGEPIIDGNKFTFHNPASAKDYAAAHNELDNMEIELDEYKRPRAPWPDETEPQHIMALEELIEFIEPED